LVLSTSCAPISYTNDDCQNCLITGDAPNYKITPIEVGEWSFNYSGVCSDGSTEGTGRVYGVASPFSCNCSDGFVVDSVLKKCVKKEEKELAGTRYKVITGSPYYAYGISGYSLIDSNASFSPPYQNINVDSSFKNFIDQNSTTIIPVATASQAESPKITRFNELVTSFEMHQTQKWYSLNVCHDNKNENDTDYVLGIGADNLYRFNLNGQDILTSRYGQAAFKIWAMTAFKLPPGKSSLSFKFRNTNSIHGYAFELFENSAAEIVSGQKTGVGLKSILTSRDFVGQKVILDDYATCGEGFEYNVCEDKCFRTQFQACLPSN
jgi:hypothetical protein